MSEPLHNSFGRARIDFKTTTQQFWQLLLEIHTKEFKKDNDKGFLETDFLFIVYLESLTNVLATDPIDIDLLITTF